jgi:hypothetical protein
MTLTPNQKRGKFAKSKGRRGEQEVVKLLKSWGLDAKRTGYHQVFGGTDCAPDVVCHQNALELRYEVKRLESFPNYLWDYLGAHDGLWMRRNDKEWLVVLPVEEYRRLLTGETNGRKTN